MNRDLINTKVFDEKGGREPHWWVWEGEEKLSRERFFSPSPILYTFFPFSLDKLLLQRLRVKVKELAE